MMGAHQNLPWRGIFRDLPREHGFEPLRVEGSCPRAARRALSLRPGTLQHRRGAVSATGSTPTVPSPAVRVERLARRRGVRTVATRWLRKEQRRQRAALSQLRDSSASGWRRWLTLPKNPANISVLPLNGRGAGAVGGGTADRARSRHARHARRDRSRRPHRTDVFRASRIVPAGTLFNFGVHYGRKFSMDLYSVRASSIRNASDLSRCSGRPSSTTSSPHAGMLVFFCPPVRLRLARLLARHGQLRLEPGLGAGARDGGHRRARSRSPTSRCASPSRRSSNGTS